MITRRLALFRIGASSAVATISAAPILVPKADAPPATLGNFKTPAEYVAAMHAIGWQPRAMFHWLPNGGVHCMGVDESAGPGVCASETWSKFHAIQMRCPVQLPTDVHPNQEWWSAVWHHLYDKGMREDVTPPKMLARLAKDDTA